MNNKLTYRDFCKNLANGAYYEFEYKDVFINVGLEKKGFFSTKLEWIYIMHKHDNSGPLIVSVYKTLELLLENVYIFGNTIYEIWDKLKLVS